MKPIRDEKGDDFLKVARAVRAALVLLVIGLAVACFCSSLSIRAINRSYADIFGVEAPPDWIVALISATPVFWATSGFIAATAIVAHFTRTAEKAFYTIGSLALIAILQVALLHYAQSLLISEMLTHVSFRLKP